ncbi:hypothetical protein BC834DRAFT_847254 [Gloeopeniophorella convolvens]|nr:hypothetical protein BC834DRAFT_847254 [Gloeopeniophorella convolvens]
MVILPALHSFIFNGWSIHLEVFTYQIVALALKHLDIQLGDDSVLAVPSLTNFIGGGARLRVPTMVAVLELSHELGGYFRAYSLPQNLTTPLIAFRVRTFTEVDNPPSIFSPSVSSVVWLCHHIAPVLSCAETLIIKHYGDPQFDDPGARWASYLPEWHMFLTVFTGVHHMVVKNIFALAIAGALGRPGGVHLLPNLHDLRFLFYSTDGHNPSNILVELEPYTTTAHSSCQQSLDVFCKTIPRKGEHPELKTGVVQPAQSPLSIQRFSRQSLATCTAQSLRIAPDMLQPPGHDPQELAMPPRQLLPSLSSPTHLLDIAHLTFPASTRAKQNDRSYFPCLATAYCEWSSDTAGSQTWLIDHVPDDVLLNVFDFYRLAAPSPAGAGAGWTWPWHSLVRVCRRWRQLILSSPKRLRLDFLLTYGAPYASILRLPPEFALKFDFSDEVYGDDDSDEDDNDSDLAGVLITWAPEDFDGVALAFREHPKRIRKINLLAHGSDLRKLFAALTGPTPQLESLRVHATNWPWPFQVFPDDFLKGSTPALCRIELTGVLPPLPSAPHITHFEFCLEHGVPRDPPSFLDNVVEHVRQMSQLETLHFYCEAYGSVPTGAHNQSPPIGPPTVLPALSRFFFFGLSIHLEVFTCRLVVPMLEDLEVHFKDQSVLAVPSLAGFIHHGAKLRVPAMVAHLPPSHGNSGSFKAYLPQDLTRPLITFYVKFVMEVDGHRTVSGALVSPVAWICRRIAPVLSSVETLIIRRSGEPRFDGIGERWALYLPAWYMFLVTFTGVRRMAVENTFALAIARALGRPTVLIAEVLGKPCRYVHLPPNLHDLRFLFYSADGYNPSDVLLELEPYTTVHSNCEHDLEVYCKTIPRTGRHSELQTGVIGVP